MVKPPYDLLKTFYGLFPLCCVFMGVCALEFDVGYGVCMIIFFPLFYCGWWIITCYGGVIKSVGFIPSNVILFFICNLSICFSICKSVFSLIDYLSLR